MEVSDNTSEKKSGNEINDITLYRKKKQRFKLVRNLVIVGIVILAFILLFIYADVIFEPLRGIASKVDTTTTDEVGFPVKLPESSSYRFEALDGSFTLLTDTYLYSYSLAGKQNFALQHGYTNPMSASNSKRILIYDKGAHGFALYNKTSKIYKQSINDEIIVSAFLSNKEKAAVITSGGQFSNVLYVFDGNGNWVYTHKFIDDSVMQAAFSSDEKYIYISSVKSDNGEIVTEIRKYRLSDDEGEIWSVEFNDCVPVELSVKNDSIIVVCDNCVHSIDSERGAENGSYTFAGNLLDHSSSETVNSFVVENYSSSGDRLIVLDNMCSEIASSSFDSDVISVYSEDGRISLLFHKQFTVFNTSLEVVSSTDVKDEYERFVKIGNDILLMGYDTIELVSI